VARGGSGDARITRPGTTAAGRLTPGTVDINGSYRSIIEKERGERQEWAARPTVLPVPSAVLEPRVGEARLERLREAGGRDRPVRPAAARPAAYLNAGDSARLNEETPRVDAPGPGVL
jgi:hypothetical protein